MEEMAFHGEAAEKAKKRRWAWVRLARNGKSNLENEIWKA